MAGEKFRGYTNSHGETKVADEHGNQWSGYNYLCALKLN